MDNKKEIIETLKALYSSNSVIELRIPKSKYGLVSGYFNDFNLLAEAVMKFDGKVAGIYITLNIVNPDLLYRAKNKLKFGREANPTTSDQDITEISWLPMDFDPVRPSDISSNDEEHEKALAKAQEVREWLTVQGWPTPIFSDSGNGGHLIYPVKLPNDQESRKLIEKCLKALDFLFSDEVVKIDTKVGNPGRIWKLYGTISAKGENSPERPWRRSRIIETPEKLIPVTRKQLEKLAGFLPESPRGKVNGSIDIERWLDEHNIKVSKIKNWNDGILYELEECPWNPEHKRTAYIIQFSSGGIAAKCFHNSCSEENWWTLRDMLEPGWRKNKPEKNQDDNPISYLSVNDILAQEKDIIPLWGNMLFSEAVHILVANTGVGKTTLIYNLIIHAANGDEFLGAQFSRPLKVLYLTLKPPGLSEAISSKR
ncbi:AAA family ATPase [Atribacter laminatus]|uniref:Uncharacterized protein n=1 Tax=Atribacter laminatus TaxID=2847778 RepID=A0A7T1F3P1_ATRLM|nr:AAA family ATPase [Atribacter laminatus]QPM68865.1 hypothetical protein RT761_02092 [Atribacter laminatus]